MRLLKRFNSHLLPLSNHMGCRNWWQNCHRVQKTPRHSTQAKVQGGPAHVKGSTYSLPCERTWRFTAAPPLHEVGMLANMLRIALLAVAFIGSCLPPNASAADILACQAKDAVNLQDDGTLKNDSLAQRAAQGSLVIDLSSGEVRSDGGNESLKMIARQHGNETVLVPSFAPEFVRNVIRIRRMAGGIVFSQYLLNLFISGTCASIQ
jgi:hypothetical protein